ncbi:hypothetical protein CPC16_010264 [Podila verticillata]|nr:hypothetical protein CPC16_010264 [Podila verticillata]
MALPIIAAAVPAAMYVSSKLAIPQDARLIGSLIGARKAYGAIEKRDTINASYRFEETYLKYPDREALVFEGRSYTFRDIHLVAPALDHFVITLSPAIELFFSTLMTLDLCVK